MNIGVHYGAYEDFGSGPFLYALSRGTAEVLNENLQAWQRGTNQKFKIHYADHVFHFSTEFRDLEYCDIKILSANIGITQEKHLKEYYDKVDYIFLHTREGEMIQGFEEDRMKQWINLDKVYFILNHRFKEYSDHPKVITDLSINLFHMYNTFGFYYLNYYPFDKKKHLIGVYNRDTQYKSYRHELLKLFTEYTGQDIHRFTSEKTFYTELSGKILDVWNWQRMHMAGYTDYATCVANVVFETQSGDHHFDMFTEKTVKSIIFQAANIFFIWVGTYRGMKWLHEKGFWFLNSEFFDPEDFVNEPYFNPDYAGVDKDLAIPVFKSAYKAVNYLKELKDRLGTDDAVYQYMLETYGHKIESNIANFKHLLENCEYTDRVMDIILKPKN